MGKHSTAFSVKEAWLLFLYLHTQPIYRYSEVPCTSPRNIMPSIRSLASACYILLTISISLNREIMSSCSCCIKKELVYIIIAALFSRQLSSCFKCTKANTHSLCDIHLVSVNKYIFVFSCDAYCLSQPLGENTW